MPALLDYAFTTRTVANPDGSHPLLLSGTELVDGPGRRANRQFPKAADFGSAGRAQVDVSGLDLDTRRFRLRVLFRTGPAFEGRQNLAESDRLPCSLFLTGHEDGPRLVATVRPAAHDWRGVDTRFGPQLEYETWYTADLVHDLDTVALFVDGAIVGVRAFPHGAIELGAGTMLHVGNWVDGRRNHFTGAVAWVRLDTGIPATLEAQLDERRSSAQWFITRKVEQVRSTVDLGEPTQPEHFNTHTGAWVQPHVNGTVMCNLSAGAAFELHGAINAAYNAMRDRDDLGALVSDELVSADPAGRQSMFTSGAIYWSAATGAHPVLDQVYLDYENLGATRAWGFPTGSATSLAGGVEQSFQRARFYHRTGQPSAHEVHGTILQRFLATGGVGAWGFPVTNESPVMDGSQQVGRVSEFERATFWWSAATGAHEVHGDLRRRYLATGGPTGPLGLPTSDEMDVPGGGRMNSFQKASLVWYGSFSSIVTVGPFQLFVATLNTDESEGFGRGENDLYMRVTITEGSRTLHREKYPPSGDWGGRNVRDVNVSIPTLLTPGPGVSFDVSIDVWESDSGGLFSNDDDHIGEWTFRLDGANAWGFRTNQGILDSGAFRKVNNIRAAVQPRWQDPSTMTEVDKFWGKDNESTDDLTTAQYAQAFRDVDSETEWWDVTDWLHKAFYELVVKDVAEGGNCFGFSLEAIYARKGMSPFSLPISRFTSWNTLQPTINVKHAYQVGAAPIWWFVGQFLTGNTHDPRDVFDRTRAAFDRGEQPVLCISQDYDFSGKPHCILPVGWAKSGSTWTMSVLDPNDPRNVRSLVVDGSANTFRYQGVGRDAEYTGGAWSGGRMHYMPFGVLCEAPRTPVWDAIILLLSGTILILADDAETDSITDAAGTNLDATSAPATRLLQQGGNLDGLFLRVPGFDGSRVLAGEFLVSRGSPTRMRGAGRATVDLSTVLDVPLTELVANRDLRRVRDILGDAVGEVGDGAGDGAGDGGVGAGGRPAGRVAGRLGSVLEGRTLPAVLADDTIELTDAQREELEALKGVRRPGDVVHKVKGTRTGRLRHVVKHGLVEYRVEAATAAGERTTVATKDLGTSAAVLSLRNGKGRQVDVLARQRLGIRGGHVDIELVGVGSAARRDIELHTTPGFGTVDLVVPGDQTVPIRLTREVDGQARTRTFRVETDGIARLTLAQSLDEGVVGVARIERPHGPVLGSDLVEADD